MNTTNAFGSVPQVGMDLTEDSEQAIAQQTKAFALTQLEPLLPASATMVTIDGLDGAGKTTLGRELASLLGSSFLDLDDFLEKRRGQYFSALRFDALQTALDSALRVVLSGCLMETVLKKIQCSSDFKIYVVRTARMRSQPELEWIDERDILCSDIPAADLIADLEQNTRQWAHAPPPFGGGDSNLPELPRAANSVSQGICAT
jgi:hypothetical protein